MQYRDIILNDNSHLADGLIAAVSFRASLRSIISFLSQRDDLSPCENRSCLIIRLSPNAPLSAPRRGEPKVADAEPRGFEERTRRPGLGRFNPEE
jgi:hypothetical protein